MSQPDPSLSPENSSGYHLSLEIGFHSCAFCVLDLNGNIYRYLSADVFPGTTGKTGENQSVSNWLSGNEMLRWNFRSSSVSFINRYSTLLPEALTDVNQLKMYLDFNFTFNEEIIPLNNSVKTQGLNNIFGVEKSISDAVRNILINPRVFHHSTVLINLLLKTRKNRSGHSLLLQFEQTCFTLLALSEKSLVFQNSFQYESPEDVVYYALCVCEQLNMDASTVELILCGWIDPVSPVYALLYAYFGNSGFLKPDNRYKLSPHLSDIPAHRFCRLFNQYFVV